ncbi:hypothetical protein CBA19CS91_39850 [Paraburkholderia hospita]|nr:hypothetical protein CBA19CS91_39850 [Paraburkholderia hospita]
MANETTMTIDMTPTWGQIGAMYVRLAESKEVKAIRALRPEVARAFAAAQALQAINDTLTEEQRAIAAKTLTEELTKQGY